MFSVNRRGVLQGIRDFSAKKIRLLFSQERKSKVPMYVQSSPRGPCLCSTSTASSTLLASMFLPNSMGPCCTWHGNISAWHIIIVIIKVCYVLLLRLDTKYDISCL